MTHIVKRYFDALAAKDMDALRACLAADVRLCVNDDPPRQGKDDFVAYFDHRAGHYSETHRNLAIFDAPDGSRAVATYTLSGTYIATDGSAPPANGQSYSLPVEATFDVKDDKITRLTLHYDRADWIAQIS